MVRILHPKSLSRSWIAGAITVLLLGSVGSYVVVSQFSNRDAMLETTVEIAPAKAVTALGRLEPEGEVIKLSVPNAADSRVNQVLTEEGDWVEAGEVIAILQGLDKKQAELSQAKQNVAIYQARLARIEAGDAKVADAIAQEAAISRLEAQLRTETAARAADIAKAEAELRNAQQQYHRYQQLHQQGAIETAVLDDRRETFETADAVLQAANAQLDNTVSTLQAQISQAQALLEKLV